MCRFEQRKQVRLHLVRRSRYCKRICSEELNSCPRAIEAGANGATWTREAAFGETKLPSDGLFCQTHGSYTPGGGIKQRAVARRHGMG